jgi:hypothetical protein
VLLPKEYESEVYNESHLQVSVVDCNYTTQHTMML